MIQTQSCSENLFLEEIWVSLMINSRLKSQQKCISFNIPSTIFCQYEIRSVSFWGIKVTFFEQVLVSNCQYMNMQYHLVVCFSITIKFESFVIFLLKNPKNVPCFTYFKSVSVPLNYDGTYRKSIDLC